MTGVADEELESAQAKKTKSQQSKSIQRPKPAPQPHEDRRRVQDGKSVHLTALPVELLLMIMGHLDTVKSSSVCK